MQHQYQPIQQVPQNQGQGAWIPLEPVNNNGSFNPQMTTQNASQPLLHPHHQNSGVPSGLVNNYNGRTSILPFDTGHTEDLNPSAYQNLEMEYKKYYHFSVVNILLGVLSIIMTLVTIFLTIFMSFDGPQSRDSQDDRDSHSNHGNRGHVENHNQTHAIHSLTQHDYHHDDNDFKDDYKRFESQAKAAICFLALVTCILNCVLYYYGKYAYDNRKPNYFKVLLIIYCILFAFAFVTTSFFNGIAFAYLGFCAYKLRLILEQMSNIGNVQH